MGHRVGRVLSFFSSRRIWDSPNPSPAASVQPPPPPPLGGGAHQERSWESPNSDEGTYTVVLFIYTFSMAWGYLFYNFPNQMFARSQLAFSAVADLPQPHSIHPFPPDEKWFFVIAFLVHLPTCMPHSFLLIKYFNRLSLVLWFYCN